MSKEQHVQLTINVFSKDNVAFNTDFGWADELSISIDMCTLEDAKKTAESFLNCLCPVPFQNDCDNEQYLEEARSVIQDAIESLKHIVMQGGKTGLKAIYPFEMTINFVETYVVEFGE